MIGLSLSFCVRDILDGKVSLPEVEKIITGTMYTDRDMFHTGMKHSYCMTYWRKDPVRGLDIAMLLWDTKRLDQPRLKNKPAPNIVDGHWVRERIVMPDEDSGTHIDTFEEPDPNAPMSALRKFLES